MDCTLLHNVQGLRRRWPLVQIGLLEAQDSANAWWSLNTSSHCSWHTAHSLTHCSWHIAITLQTHRAWHTIKCSCCKLQNAHNAQSAHTHPTCLDTLWISDKCTSGITFLRWHNWLHNWVDFLALTARLWTVGKSSKFCTLQQGIRLSVRHVM